MKKILQIVQKYIFPTMICIFGVLFIYGLIFATPLADLIIYMLYANGDIIIGKEKYLNDLPEVVQIAQNTSLFSNQLLIFAIIGLVLTGIVYLLRSNIRNKYYLTNTISVGALSLYSAFTSIYCISYLSNYLNILHSIDFEKFYNFEKYIEIDDDGNIIGEFSKFLNTYNPIEVNSFYYVIGYIVFGLLLVLSVLVLIILINKIISNNKLKTKNI